MLGKPERVFFSFDMLIGVEDGIERNTELIPLSPLTDATALKFKAFLIAGAAAL